MELLVSKPNEAVFIQKLLNIFDLNAKILNRDKGYMIYIKEAEKISDYIKILELIKPFYSLKMPEFIVKRKIKLIDLITVNKLIWIKFS